MDKVIVRNGDDLGAALRELRRLSGQSQSKVAIVVGVDPTYISHLESGRRLPSPTLLLSLLKVLGGELVIQSEENP